MDANTEISDRELREAYELLSKDALIRALIEKHKEMRKLQRQLENHNSRTCPHCGFDAFTEHRLGLQCASCGFIQ